MQLNLWFRIIGNNFLPSLTFMAMLIRKAASCLEILSVMLACMQRVFFLQSISPQYVNISNSNPATSVKSRWVPVIKIKIYQRRDVQGSLSIVGLTPLTATPYKQAYLKMSKLMKKESLVMDKDSMGHKFTNRLEQKCFYLFLQF